MPARRWGKWWLVGIGVWSAVWLAVVLEYRWKSRQVTAALLADLTWVDGSEMPSDQLTKLLDAAGAPGGGALLAEEGPLADPTVATVSERLLGSRRLEATVRQRIVMAPTHPGHSRACIALATFADDYSRSGGARTAVAATELVELADESCRNGLPDAVAEQHALLQATTEKRLDLAELYRREQALHRWYDYRFAHDAEHPLVSVAISYPAIDDGAMPPSTLDELAQPIRSFFEHREQLSALEARRAADAAAPAELPPATVVREQARYDVGSAARAERQRIAMVTSWLLATRSAQR